MAASASAAFSQGFLAHSSAHFCDKKFFYFKSLFAQSFRPASWQVRIRGDATCRRYLRVLARSEQLSEDDDDDDDNGPSKKDESNERDADSFRDRLEKIVGDDDAAFDGKDLATLIRNKYGRSYDVQLIKREFMGRQLLAMNVMWKYREQRSFPLTEEEYLLRLDDVANNLRCWGAVSYVRNSLAKTKERPRMGKAVSIFIDLDDSGGRANEWIYR